VDRLTNDPPYLSVVVASRNDTHGGDPLARLHALINSFSAQCQRFGLSAEIVVVEWNPPADRHRLKDVVRLPPASPLVVRFIEVPRSLHDTIQIAERLPLFQMMAKNVGIRRAAGEFVLSTNIDIVCSNELVRFIAERRLERGRIYRVDRHDIQSSFPVEAPLDVQMAYCAGQQLRVHAREGTYSVRPDGQPTFDDDVADGRSVAIGDGWHVREGSTESGWYRWAGDCAHLLVESRAQSGAVLELELESNPYSDSSWCEVELCDNGVPMVRRRIGPEIMRVCLALDEGSDIHDVEVRVVDREDDRLSLPLYERRLDLAFRLRRARLRELNLAVARSHEYRTHGPFRAPADGLYHWLVSLPSTAAGSTALLDDVNGERLQAEISEIIGQRVHLRLVSAQLRKGQLVWLGGAQGRVSGSAPMESIGVAGTTALLSVLLRRLGRAVRSVQRRARMALMPGLKDALARFDPTPVASPTLTCDERAGTTTELRAIRDFLRAFRPPPLHQNACGDFQLMAREHWIALRGFAEFSSYSMSLDGLMSAAADSVGLVETVLEAPACIYHIEHERGSGWTPEGESHLRRRLAERGVTWIDHRTVHIWSAYMAWLKRPMIFNGPDWGFGTVVLREDELRSTKAHI
jgi:hypothetical protein